MCGHHNPDPEKPESDDWGVERRDREWREYWLRLRDPALSMLQKCWHLRLAPLVIAVRMYQRWLSPILPSACRFEPSCSVYTMQAIRERGVISGILMGGWRILRCNPWCKGGLDPVEAFRWPWQRSKESASAKGE